MRSLEKWDETAFDRSLDINFKGPFFLIQALLPLYANPASIVVNGSINAHLGMPNSSVYSASKAFADVGGRRLYIPRKGPGRITVFNLDTLEPAGEIPDAAANGVVVDRKSGHGFASSQPVVMWDAKT
jgi:NAD(P)-dependent dehydrogenase (short-subunit alcohol dehydrogenase family)